MAKVLKQNVATDLTLEQMFDAKKEARKKRADLPILEKLRIVERLREASRLIKNSKEIPANKTP